MIGYILALAFAFFLHIVCVILLVYCLWPSTGDHDDDPHDRYEDYR